MHINEHAWLQMTSTYAPKSTMTQIIIWLRLPWHTAYLELHTILLLVLWTKACCKLGYLVIQIHVQVCSYMSTLRCIYMWICVACGIFKHICILHICKYACWKTKGTDNIPNLPTPIIPLKVAYCISILIPCTQMYGKPGETEWDEIFSDVKMAFTTIHP